MKLFTSYWDDKVFKKYLEEVKDVDFSLFINSFPSKPEDLSSINILALCEPNEYFGWNDHVIKNQHLFDVILTVEKDILDKCPNSMFFTLGHTWMKPDQYNKVIPKKYELAHLAGALKKAPGHMLRHELLEKEHLIKMPTKFFETYGDRHDIEKARIGRAFVYSTSEYNIAIENFAKEGWFTEKLIDCFLFKSIPIYWGDPEIDRYFDPEGIITFDGNVDELIYTINNIGKDFYQSKIKVLEENFQRSLEWVNYEKNLSKRIINIFKYNNII